MIATVVDPPNWLVIVTLVPLFFTLILRLNVDPLLVITVAEIGLGPATAIESTALGLLLDALAVTVITPLLELWDAEMIVIVSFGIIEVLVAGADVVVLRVVGGTVVFGGGTSFIVELGFVLSTGTVELTILDEVEVGLAAQDVVAGVEAPGQGFSCPTMTSFAGAAIPKDPGVYGPDPLEMYGRTSKRFGKIGVPNAVSSGKVYSKMG